jgi:hypothetical protein
MGGGSSCRLVGICNTVRASALSKMTSCLEIQPSRTVPGTWSPRARAPYSRVRPWSPKRLQVKCGCCERDTPASAAFCPGRRWRPPPNILDRWRGLAAELHATAIVGPSFPAAITAGFLRCAERLQIARYRFRTFDRVHAYSAGSARWTRESRRDFWTGKKRWTEAANCYLCARRLVVGSTVA